jgi:hypothetical protein
MERIVVDQNLPAKLADILHPVELCDGEGRVLGRFTPVLDPIDICDSEPQLSEEEWRRREEEPGGRSLREILADLEAKG